MPMLPGKRIISYHLPAEMTLADFRRIVKETESIDALARVRLPHSLGQRDQEVFEFVLEEGWPTK